MSNSKNRRILLIDDNASIHEDFKKILTPVEDKATGLADMRAAFLTGGSTPAEPEQSDAESTDMEFEITSALQGEEGYETLCCACDANTPFAMAFVDMRMPPGWDGVQTIAKLWERDPDLQVVVCTAFSDYTWEETVAELGQSDRLLILKKPFDAIEISQLASALTEKWNGTMEARKLLEDVQRAEQEARAYASSLETVNHSLITAKAAADMSADLKTEFLVRLSTEVSCKLGEVLGNVELLNAPGSASNEEQSQVEAMLEVGQHLMQTITEILDITTLEAGDVELQLEEFDPQDLVQSILEEYAAGAEAKGIALEVKPRGPLPSTICTEERHLHKLLKTLIDNAVHWTQTGTVSVSLALASTESWQRPRMTFEVTDSGCGISRERLGSIFEPYSRSESEPGSAGYGFGLALAKRLSALLNGDLSVRSEVGQGTTFTVNLEIGAQIQQAAA